MPAKPFRIIEIPPDPPSADKLAREHHLSTRERTVIKEFTTSVRSGKTVHSGSSAGGNRLVVTRRAAARKK